MMYMHCFYLQQESDVLAGKMHRLNQSCYLWKKSAVYFLVCSVYMGKRRNVSVKLISFNIVIQTNTFLGNNIIRSQFIISVSKTVQQFSWKPVNFINQVQELILETMHSRHQMTWQGTLNVEDFCVGLSVSLHSGASMGGIFPVF